MNPLDMITYMPVSMIIIGLLLISIREIRRSLEKDSAIEAKLTNNLGIIDKSGDIEELKENRIAKIAELGRSAEFGRMSEGLVHDLITPLTSIMLHSEKSIDSKSLQASRRIASHVNDVRAALSREETPKSCNMAEELDTALHLLAFKIRNKNINVVVEKDSAIWYGSPIKLRQVLQNLISNSIDSFEKIPRDTEKTITITINSHSIIVKDNGSGIKKEHMDKIFKPFFTTKTSDRGVGIGLATVKSIVEKDFHGTIEVESGEGSGSVFTIKFQR